MSLNTPTGMSHVTSGVGRLWILFFGHSACACGFASPPTPTYPTREIKQLLQIFVVAYFVLSDVGCHVIIVLSSATGTIWL